MTRDLEGRTALITGGTSGIGAAIARAFVAAGARVILHGLEEDAGRQLADELAGRYVPGDFTDPATPGRLAEALSDEDRLDVLVNNAGFEVPLSATDLEPAILNDLLQVNLVAPTQLVRLLYPRLADSSGSSVINVTSIHASVPVQKNIGYAMAKAALAMYTRSAAIELAPLGIRVNAVAPGAIVTPMNSDVLTDIGHDTFANWIPLGRLGLPDDVADVAAFLASDRARYMTGATLVVDGAYSLNLVRY